MIINANALHLPIADNTVQCCVTSPPYYGLRDYGTAKWQGGDSNCDHKVGRFESPVSDKQKSNSGSAGHQAAYVCPRCGAIRIDDQIGLEPTPDEYVAKLVAVFREVKRVLKDDGVLWLNLGDSYASNGERSNNNGEGKSTMGWANQRHETLNKAAGIKMPAISHGMKPKDLIGIPWMVAFALRADGWYLRSDIIWSKPNPMPESVKDRPTKAHEYVFLLTKSAKYYYDSDSIQEVATGYDGRKDTMYKGGDKDMAGGAHERWKYKNLQEDGQQPNSMHLKRLEGEEYLSPVRNKRSVWTVNTQPFKGAHFAVMPEKLVEPCVLAGTSEYGQCPKCGANWERVTEKIKDDRPFRDGGNTKAGNAGIERRLGDNGWNLPSAQSVTTGWQPTCNCNAGREPNIVLDPFAGSGTVGVVAQKFGRRFIGVELNPEYVKLAEARMMETPISLFIPQEVLCPANR